MNAPVACWRLAVTHYVLLAGISLGVDHKVFLDENCRKLSSQFVKLFVEMQIHGLQWQVKNQLILLAGLILLMLLSL